MYAPRTRTPPTQVSITAEGAKGKSQRGSGLSMHLSHPGRADIVDSKGQRQTYTHLRRYIEHAYEVNNGSIITQVGLCAPSGRGQGP